MIKFKSLQEFLNESKKQEEPKYGCIMLNADVKNYKKLCKSIVDEKDIYDDEKHEYGYESVCHITLLYGIHNDEVDKKELFKDISNLKHITCEINKISIFENDDYDVVKFDVEVSKELKEYRKLFEEKYPNTQTFKTYHPHLTICYVKKGEGKKYIQKLEDPIEINFNEGVYSDPDYSKKYFKLK
jgi:2'-5' RNA ligase